MRPPSPSIPEKEFLLEALNQSLRLDGRALLEQRQPTLEFGPDLGWVECSLDKTRHVPKLIPVFFQASQLIQHTGYWPRLTRQWSSPRRNGRLRDPSPSIRRSRPWRVSSTNPDGRYVGLFTSCESHANVFFSCTTQGPRRRKSYWPECWTKY
jgi:hypothetical protein